MEARIIGSENIIEVTPEFDSDGFINGYSDNTGRKYKYNEIIRLDIMDSKIKFNEYSDTINWKQRRYEIAKEALQGILSNSNRIINGGSIEENSFLAISYADEMIKQLKESEEN